MNLPRLALLVQHNSTARFPFESLQFQMNGTAVVSLDEPNTAFGFISIWWWRILKFTVVPGQEAATFCGFNYLTRKVKTEGKKSCYAQNDKVQAEQMLPVRNFQRASGISQNLFFFHVDVAALGERCLVVTKMRMGYEVVLGK